MHRVLLVASLFAVAVIAAVRVSGGPELAAWPGSESIEPQRGIAGVRLNEPERQVRELLGPPDVAERTDLHPGYRTWRYTRVPLVVSLDDAGRVWDVRTDSERHRSARGWGVGSTEGELRSSVPSLHCDVDDEPQRGLGARNCTDRPRHDGPFTAFALADGRVVRVTVTRGLVR